MILGSGQKLVKKLVWFLFPIFALLGGIELFYRLVPNNYNYKDRLVRERYQDTEVLILGGSHTFYGLDPQYFQYSTFNLAGMSQTILIDQLLFQKHVPHMPNLKWVVLNVEYYSLSMQDTALMNEDRKHYYNTFMDIDVPTVSALDPKSYFVSLNRRFSINLNLIESYFEKGSILYCDRNGFGSFYNKDRAIGLGGSATEMSHHENYSLDFALNLSRLEEMITFCAQRNIRVMLVTMPVSSPYAALADPSKLARIVASCEALQAKYSNLTYLNMFQTAAFNDDDFFDADHLHDEGAKKCSLIVNRAMLSEGAFLY